MGFIYTAIGTSILVFGSEKLKILAIIYILMPIIMGIFGFIFFVIFAAIYNLLAKWFVSLLIAFILLLFLGYRRLEKKEI